MEINYWAVLVCSVLAMIIGAIWYGPLFGRKWVEIIGATSDDLEARKQMQKSAGKLYVVQFILTLFQVWVLAGLVGGSNDALQNVVWIWVAFVVPIVAGGAMWNNDSAKVAWARFFIQAGYQLVIFVVFGLVLGMWR